MFFKEIGEGRSGDAFQVKMGLPFPKCQLSRDWGRSSNACLQVTSNVPTPIPGFLNQELEQWLMH
jgi:hypothetical protein